MKIKFLDGEKLYHAFLSGKHEVLKRRKHLDKINVFPVPDGDTGTNLVLTMQSIFDGTKANKHVSEMSRGMAQAAIMGSRGNSGIIFAQFIHGLSEAIKGKKVLNPKEFSQAMKRGVEHAATSKYMQALSSAGLCMFGSLTGEVPLEGQIAAATGWEVTADDWMTAGHRIQTARQLFNAREDVRPSSITLPERAIEKQEKGPFKKALLDVEAMKKGFYRALEWDEETGVPTDACLQSLGIEKPA